MHGSGSSDEDEDTLVRRVAATRKVGDGQRRSVDGEGGAMPSGLQTVDTEVDGGVRNLTLNYIRVYAVA